MACLPNGLASPSTNTCAHGIFHCFIIELMHMTTKGQMKWVAMDGVRRRRPHIGGVTPLPMVTSPAWSPGLVLMKTEDPMKAADRSAST
jgi:hypothetical protein